MANFNFTNTNLVQFYRHRPHQYMKSSFFVCLLTFFHNLILIGVQAEVGTVSHAVFHSHCQFHWLHFFELSFSRKLLVPSLVFMLRNVLNCSENVCRNSRSLAQLGILEPGRIRLMFSNSKVEHDYQSLHFIFKILISLDIEVFNFYKWLPLQQYDFIFFIYRAIIFWHFSLSHWTLHIRSISDIPCPSSPIDSLLSSSLCHPFMLFLNPISIPHPSDPPTSTSILVHHYFFLTPSCNHQSFPSFHRTSAMRKIPNQTYSEIFPSICLVQPPFSSSLFYHSSSMRNFPISIFKVKLSLLYFNSVRNVLSVIPCINLLFDVSSTFSINIFIRFKLLIYVSFSP